MKPRIQPRLLLALLICGSVMAHGQTVLKTMKRLPDTGQNGDYTSTRGEDSDVRMNTQGFVVGNGVVSDTVTTLMWQQSDGGEMTWSAAKNYCDTLFLGGYSDWRLPSCHELFSIHDFQRNNPAIPVVFATTDAQYWWSVDTLRNDGSRIWCTNSGGGVGPHPMNETISAGGSKRFHVRAVRDQTAPSSIPSQFRDNGNETITDDLTGLTWMQYCLESTMSWEAALQAADTSTVGGHTDWRLPNIKELQSINLERLRDPSIDIRYFPCVASAKSLWSSTTQISKTNSQAWILQPEFGIVSYAEKTTLNAVLCVRGGTPDVTSVDDEEYEGGLVVYPNPTTGLLQLSMTVSNVRVFSLHGTEVLSSSYCSVIDLSMLAPGVYMLDVIVVDGGRQTTMILKY